jgi:hypothetical protein
MSTERVEYMETFEPMCDRINTSHYTPHHQRNRWSLIRPAEKSRQTRLRKLKWNYWARKKQVNKLDLYQSINEDVSMDTVEPIDSVENRLCECMWKLTLN